MQGWCVFLSLLAGLAGCGAGARSPVSESRDKPPVGAGQESTLEATGDDGRAIDAVYASFTEAYETLDPDLVANLYTANAVYLGPGRDALRGRAAIRDSFAGSFARTAERGESMTIAFDRFDRRIEGDAAYEVGYYRVTRTTADGQVKVGRGKFAVVLLRQPDGSWQFHVDSYSDVPDTTRAPESSEN